eukprot:CAMPEP_0196810410 /NCGR_PEP_ID=MMETSP1362-20130617/10236_1 /TAXON_ID=163516 /ORGANISM="Leptocylindrus danicus, Strain CCMP1856" /LENGTH=235 /DNA_ID=CAMNT_0042185395 /DNA_START=143 /DNA_END=847 /DNA_ORIENTATION=+
MSLRGRYIIDRINKSIGHRLKLPCPPYGDPSYWEGVYRKLGPSDVFEWGDITYGQDLGQHKYRCVDVDLSSFGFKRNLDAKDVKKEASFRDAIGLEGRVESGKIMLLGCGNSELGEDMVRSGHFPSFKVVQVDVSQNVIQSMEKRCVDLISSGKMDIVLDDAAALTAFAETSISATVDKGLVDALYCSRDFEIVNRVMESVHRTLAPQGVFLMLSFSQPDFVLPNILEQKSSSLW